MRVRHRLFSFDSGYDLVVLVNTQGDVTSGKFLVGRHLIETNLMALVLADVPFFHTGIAQKYHVHPLGGGIFEIDSGEQTIHLYGASKAYGREASRDLTARALLGALPDWRITVE